MQMPRTRTGARDADVQRAALQPDSEITRDNTN